MSKFQAESRGFLVLCGGVGSVILIRELDAVFDQITHGFWVYPAIVVALIILIYVRKSPGTVSRSVAYYFQTFPFAYIIIGLMTVLFFSRIFGSSIIWKVVMGIIMRLFISPLFRKVSNYWAMFLYSMDQFYYGSDGALTN